MKYRVTEWATILRPYYYWVEADTEEDAIEKAQGQPTDGTLDVPECGSDIPSSDESDWEAALVEEVKDE